MTVTNGYCTVAQLKLQAGIDDVIDDTILENAINSVSRWIDNYCWRRFFSTTADETRYYTPQGGGVVIPDDIVSITTLKTDDDSDRVYETTWSATADYDLEPVNAALDGWPYTKICVNPNSSKYFPKVKRGVEIVGKFGWSTAPAEILQACLIQSARIFKRKDSPYGIAGTTQLGVLQLIPGLDSDVKAMIDQYRRVGVE